MQILGARGDARSPEERLSVAREQGHKAGGAVQLLDARFVLGRDHLVSAAEHAERAMREGRNAAKSLSVEFVLYAAGERQISSALQKVGVRDDTTEFAVVVFGGNATDDLLRSLDLVRDDRVLEPSLEKLKAFGFTEAELATVPPDRAADLVFERTALVDVVK